MHQNGTVYYPVHNSSDELVLMMPGGAIPVPPAGPQQPEPLIFTTPEFTGTVRHSKSLAISPCSPRSLMAMAEVSTSSLPLSERDNFYVAPRSFTSADADDADTSNFPHQTRLADDLGRMKKGSARRMTVTVVRGGTKDSETGGRWDAFHKRNSVVGNQRC